MCTTKHKSEHLQRAARGTQASELGSLRVDRNSCGTQLRSCTSQQRQLTSRSPTTDWQKKATSCRLYFTCSHTHTRAVTHTRGTLFVSREFTACGYKQLRRVLGPRTRLGHQAGCQPREQQQRCIINKEDMLTCHHKACSPSYLWTLCLSVPSTLSLTVYITSLPAWCSGRLAGAGLCL